jgi:chromate reductase, NAD(P)H dehydrogenase (quinone)
MSLFFNLYFLFSKIKTALRVCWETTLLISFLIATLLELVMGLNKSTKKWFDSTNINMITVISGTNRPNSRTKLIAKYCFDTLTDSNESVQWIDLVEIQNEIISTGMYTNDGQNQVISDIQEEIIIPANLLLIVTPEYNGSFPGVLKSFIDALSVRDHKGTFSGKIAGLIGTSTGRAGNLRGMEHLTGILNYLNVTVMPNKLPISSIQTFLDGTEIKGDLKVLLNQYLEELLTFSRKI